MKKIYQTNSLSWKRLFMSLLLTLPFLGIMQAQAQTITINSLPTGPLYVGDTIEVEFSSAGFSADAIFYLALGTAPNDTIIGSMATDGIFKTTVPAGFTSPAAIRVYGATGDLDGLVETKPIFGELDLAGTSTTTPLYDDETYEIDFWEANIRRMELPGINMVGDTAIFEFNYRYSTSPDTLELVVEYSTNGGSSFNALDTLEYVNTIYVDNHQVGIPAVARTGNTILRVRQLYSNIINDDYAYRYYIKNPSVYVGEAFVEEGSQALAGSPYTLNLPYTDVTDVYGPSDAPYSGNTYVGDSIYIEANIVGFTDPINYQIVFNESGNIADPIYKLSGYTTEDLGGDSYLYSGVLPKDVNYNDTYTFWVVPYTGSTYLHGNNSDYDFATFGVGTHTINGEEVIDGTYGIYFTAENVREVITPEYIISETGSMLVEMSRRENIFSPESAEILIEYSTDGSTYTEIGTTSLNAMKVYNVGTTTFEFNIPAGAISNTTTFRISQPNINAENLDRFYVKSYEISLNSNKLVDAVDADYSANIVTEYLYAPRIDLKTIVTPESLFYPGTAIDMDYEVTMGKLPTGATIEARFNSGQGIILGSSTNLTSGTISSTIPAVGYANYYVNMQSLTAYGNASNNSRQITVENVELEILEVTGNPEREVDGTVYYFPGDELIVDYDLIGTATNGVQLQIKDVNNDWITIGNDNPADETMTGIIPQDVELPASPQIRLALDDETYSSSTVSSLYNRYPRSSDFMEAEEDSMIIDAAGYVDDAIYNPSQDNPTFAENGVRFAETENFDLKYGYSVYVRIYLLDNYYTFEDRVNKVAPITVQYSIDNGTTWVEIGSVKHTDYTGYNRQSVTINGILPEAARTENTRFRIIQNENNDLNFGENAWELERFYLYRYIKSQIFSGTYSLNLQQASVSLGTLPKLRFAPGEALTIPYNVAGNFGSDIGFATILENNSTGEEHVVAYNDATGQVQLNTNIPVNLIDTYISANPNYFNLFVKPYQKTVAVDYPVLDFMEDLDDDAEDMIAIEGGTYNSTSDRYDMTQEGRRSILTKALPQVDGEFAYLEFYTWYSDLPYPTEAVFVEISYDGGNTFTVLDTILETGTNTIEIVAADITNETHVRWVQHENFGTNNEDWRLSNIEYMGSNSNIMPTSYYVAVNQSTDIEIEYPDHPADFTFNTQEDVIYSGETFTLELGSKLNRPQFSDQTEYIFYLGDGSGNVITDYTNGQEVILGTMTGLGTVDLTIPSTIFKDRYEILTTIQIDDPDSDKPFVYYTEDRLMYLDIYNPTLKTTVTSKEVYRGNEATVTWEVETSTVNAADYYFQLWLDEANYGTVDEGEIIYTQKGASTAITAVIPTGATTGSRNIEVLVTYDSLYQEGLQTILDAENDDEWRDIQNGSVNSNGIYFNSTTSTSNKAISQDFNMSLGGTVEFRVTYPETSVEFLPSHKIILEYSQNDGDTYDKLDEFPNENYKLGDGWENQKYYFAKGVLGDTVRFRIRRESPNYGQTYYIDDFTVTENSNEVPINTINDQISILSQSFELAPIPENICRGNSFNLDYEILGVFNEKATQTIQYQLNSGTWYDLGNDMLNILDGTGTFVVNMPEDLAGGDYGFRIKSSAPDISTMYSNPTEDEVYLIPQINFNGTTLDVDVDLCTPDAVNYTIDSPQDGFAYRARNVATGDWVSEEVISDGSNIVLTSETITEETEYEIVVTALSKDGELTCATGVLNDRITFNLTPQRTLFTHNGFDWVPVEEGYSLCEGSSITLQTSYYDKEGNYVLTNPTSVGWYRDDLTTAVASTISLSTFNQSGTYFAQVIDGACKYLTNTVEIEVLEKPEKPTIVSSGETTVCGGEFVSLTANEDHPYYKWYGGSNGTTELSGSSQNIDVRSDGVYRVVASNYPIEKSCLSAKSDPISVTVLEDPKTYIENGDGGTQLNENYFVSCGDEVILEVHDQPLTFSWMRNGQAMTSNSSADDIVATKTGYYKVVTLQEANGVTCRTTTDSIYVMVTEAVERPTITVTGDTKFCAGEGSATLTAPAGYAGYWWSGHTTMPDYEVESNIMNIQYTGNYEVAVVDANGCTSDYSNFVDILVVSKPDDYGNLSTLNYNNAVCGEQEAVIRLESVDTDRQYVYQLIDMASGLPSGDPVMITDAYNTDFVELTSATITENTEFGVLVSDADFDGCDVMINSSITINVNTAEIEVVGNRLYANDNGQDYQWYRNDEPIIGDRGTNDYLEVLDDADYKVEIRFSTSCTLMSTTVSGKGVTAIGDPIAESSVQLYPNPVIDKISLEMSNEYTGQLTIRVVNLVGQILIGNSADKSSQHFKSEINMQDLSSGVYFIHIISGENKVVKKIVKQ